MHSADTSSEFGVYTFRATLVGVRGVSRELAVRGGMTLEDLHGLLQIAYDWDGDHLYAFWRSGKFWDRETGAGFGRPDVCDDSGDRSVRVRLDRLGLEAGQTIAYVFDFGDQWRVRLKLVEIRETAGVPETAILKSRGVAPPQYG
jgi:pRiA4b ORF-3-like protein